MKKLFVALFISMVILSGVSAGAATGLFSKNGAFESGSALMDLDLKLASGDLEGFRAGFSSDDPTDVMTEGKSNMDTGVPTDTVLAKISFNKPVNAVASTNTAYIYYKFRTTTTLKLKIDGPALSGGSGLPNTIDYTVTFGTGRGTNKTVGDDTNATYATTASSTPWVATITPVSGFAAGAFPFTITTAPINATQTGNWKSQLKLTVATN